ncbi:MAG: diguanylate cyclase [Pyrinomonadaceae bacterium]|nr:diguanylate cyclase [Phycisphaerales bacterium]
MAHEESKPVVLLVDDSVAVHRLLQVRLKNENFVLKTSLSGKDAIAKAKAEPPATILLDLEMPEMDGFEVLRALKDDITTLNVPVIVLSGRISSEDKVTAFDLGANDYVTKPCDLAELRARLRAVLRLDRLLKLLAERAEVDGLTGLGNRAAFNRRWEEKVAEVTRYKMPLSLAMIDADFFKRVNDTYGHPAGDEVLQGIAQLLQRECRTADLVCRYGGEEFTIIMTNTGPKDALAVAERIRAEIAKMVWPRHPESPVTVSVGLAGSDGNCGAVSPEQWLELADRNLYQAKHQGRNRVILTDLRDNLPIGLAKAG